MFLGSARRRPLVLMSLHFLFLTVALVAGDFVTYLSFGQHALCMQDWKKAVKGTLATLKTNADQALVDMETVNDTLQTAVIDLDAQLTAVNVTVHQLSDSLNGATSSSGASPFETPMSAFQTYVSDLGTSGSGTENSLVYSNEVLDENDDFDTTTGLFTCPKLGLYWFHATMTGSSREEVLMKVKRTATGDFEKIAYMKYYVSQETSTTAMAVLYPGDTVGVYPIDDLTVSLTGGAGNTFAGYLMADYDDPNYTPPSTTAAPTTTAAPSTTAAPTTTTTAGPTTTTTAGPTTTTTAGPTTTTTAGPTTTTTAGPATTTTTASAPGTTTTTTSAPGSTTTTASATPTTTAATTTTTAAATTSTTTPTTTIP